MGRGATLPLLLALALALATAAAAALPPSPSPNPPHDEELAARQSSFAFLGPKPRPPYPVKWDDDDDDASPAHDLHVDPGMLFLRKSLFPGAILPEGTKFAGNNPAASPAARSFLSRAAADAIPFGYNLDTILSTFRIPRGSTVADQVAATLRICEEPSPPPEPHVCTTSSQAAIALAAAVLGTSEPRAVVAVVHGEEEASRYAVAPNGVVRIGGGGGKAVVACHPMPYPYMVHYCHRPVGVEALRVELTRTGGGGATVVAMCHADTARWDGRYFRMLNATRGEEICHFMPRGYVLWLPAA